MQVSLRSSKRKGAFAEILVRVYSSKGRIVFLGRIVLASGQIFRSDFRPEEEIFRPGMAFCPLDEQALKISLNCYLTENKLCSNIHICE